jgi:hypothetical protein
MYGACTHAASTYARVYACAGTDRKRQDLVYHEQSLEALRDCAALPYSCRLEQLSPELAAAFVELAPTGRTLEFLRANPPHSLSAAMIRSVAGASAHTPNRGHCRERCLAVVGWCGRHGGSLAGLDVMAGAFFSNTDANAVLGMYRCPLRALRQRSVTRLRIFIPWLTLPRGHCGRSTACTS